MGDPIDTFTGNFFFPVSEFVSVGGVEGFGLERFYNSRDTRSGSLGQGWRTNFDASVVEVDGTATVTLADGDRVVFPGDGSGGFLRPSGILAELIREPDGSLSLVGDDGLVSSFDLSGRFDGSVDADGVSVTVVRNSAGRVTSVASSLGASMSFSYSGALLVGVSTSDSRSVGFGYKSGRLTSSVDPMGKVSTYTYDTRGFLSVVTDPTARVVVDSTYDMLGRVVEQWSVEGGLESYDYDDASGVTTQRIDGTGEEWSYHHNVFGDVLGVTDPFLVIDDRTVGGYRFWDSVTDRRGVTSTVGRDGDGRVTSISHPGVGTVSAAYDAAGRITALGSTGEASMSLSYTGSGSSRVASAIVDGLGKSTTRTVSGGLIVSETDPDGVETEFSYTAERLVESVSVDGAVTEFDYWPTGWLKKVTSPEGREWSYTYDASGRVLSESSPGGGVSSYVYDDAGRLLTVTDPTSAVWSYTYDSVGRLATETVPGRLPSEFSYNSLGELISVTDPSGETTETTYGPAGRVLSTVDEAGRETLYGYGVDGRVESVTAPDGGMTEYVHDQAGRLSVVRDPLGRESLYSYDDAGRMTSVTDPEGGVTTTIYDDIGRIESVEDQTGRVTSYTYTDAGRLESVTSPSGDVIVYGYDPSGRVATVTDSLSNVTSYTYSGDGLVEVVTDPGGGETSFTYDDDGNIETVTDPAGVVTTRSWTDRGELASEQVSGRDAVSYDYRPDGLLGEVIGSTGGVSEYDYDAAGRMIGRSTPAGEESWTYDDGDLLVYEAPLVGGSPRQWSYTYDDAGRVATVSEPTGRVTTNVYDLAGQITTQSFAGSGLATLTHSYSYDDAGRVVSVDTPTGLYSQSWDKAGRLQSYVDPDGREVRYGYDTGGRRDLITAPDGTGIVTTYDSGGRVAQISPNSSMTDWFTGDDDTEVDPTKWLSNATGGSTAVLDDNTAKIATPNNVGAGITLESRHPSTADVAVTVSFEPVSTDSSDAATFAVGIRQGASGDGYRVVFPSDGHTASLIKTVGGTDSTLGTFTIPTGGTQTTTRVEAVGSVIRAKAWASDDPMPSTWGLSANDTQITSGGKVVLTTERIAGSNEFHLDDFDQRNDPTTPLAPLVTNTYNADGQLTAEVLAGGDSRSYSYVDGRLDVFGETINAVTRTVALSYDTAGAIETLDDGVAKRSFSYDTGGQLVSDTGGDADRAWTYDPAGRRVTQTIDGITTNYSYNAASELLTAISPARSTVYGYDAAGRRTSEAFGTESTTYSYDAAGRSTLVETASNGLGTITQTRGFNPHGVMDRNLITGPGGVVLADHKYDWDLVDSSGVVQVVGITNGSGAGGLVRNGDRWALSIHGGTPESFSTDVFGSVVDVGGQALAGATSWDPYGVAQISSTTPGTFLGYRGELTTLGDVYLRARDYDPVTGVFHSVDPLDDVAGSTTSGNSYHYAYNDPLNRTDPTGMRPDDCGVSIFGWCPGQDDAIATMTAVASAAMGVACGAAVGGATTLSGPAAVIAAGAAGNACSGYTQRLITRWVYGPDTPSPLDPTAVTKDAIIGAATAAAFHGATKLLTPTTPSRLGSYTNWGDEMSDGVRVVDQPFGSRGVAPDFADGTRSPGAGFEWRGTGSPVSRQGNWYNPRTGESLHPDLGHPGPIGPHYDYKAPDGTWYRIFQDGRMEPK